jgi:hypothetical protein
MIVSPSAEILLQFSIFSKFGQKTSKLIRKEKTERTSKLKKNRQEGRIFVVFSQAHTRTITEAKIARFF